MSDLHPLEEDELRALAGLLYAMVTADGRFSVQESEAIADLASLIARPNKGASPYRDGASGETLSPEELFALIEEASKKNTVQGWIEAAKEGVERQDARESIYILLYQVAAADLLESSEISLLDELGAAWKISAASL